MKDHFFDYYSEYSISIDTILLNSTQTYLFCIQCFHVYGSISLLYNDLIRTHNSLYTILLHMEHSCYVL